MSKQSIRMIFSLVEIWSKFTQQNSKKRLKLKEYMLRKIKETGVKNIKRINITKQEITKITDRTGLTMIWDNTLRLCLMIWSLMTLIMRTGRFQIRPTIGILTIMPLFRSYISGITDQDKLVMINSSFFIKFLFLKFKFSFNISPN